MCQIYKVFSKARYFWNNSWFPHRSHPSNFYSSNGAFSRKVNHKVNRHLLNYSTAGKSNCTQKE